MYGRYSEAEILLIIIWYDQNDVYQIHGYSLDKDLLYKYHIACLYRLVMLLLLVSSELFGVHASLWICNLLGHRTMNIMNFLAQKMKTSGDKHGCMYSMLQTCKFFGQIQLPWSCKVMRVSWCVSCHNPTWVFRQYHNWTVIRRDQYTHLARSFIISHQKVSVETISWDAEVIHMEAGYCLRLWEAWDCSLYAVLFDTKYCKKTIEDRVDWSNGYWRWIGERLPVWKGLWGRFPSSTFFASETSSTGPAAWQTIFWP